MPLGVQLSALGCKSCPNGFDLVWDLVQFVETIEPADATTIGGILRAVEVIVSFVRQSLISEEVPMCLTVQFRSVVLQTTMSTWRTNSTPGCLVSSSM